MYLRSPPIVAVPGVVSSPVLAGRSLHSSVDSYTLSYDENGEVDIEDIASSRPRLLSHQLLDPIEIMSQVLKPA